MHLHGAVESHPIPIRTPLSYRQAFLIFGAGEYAGTVNSFRHLG